MPTSSFDPSPDDVVVTYNWPNSCTNPSFLGRNRPQRLELEDFEDDSFHPQSYVFERIHCMEEEEEVGRPYHNPNISAKLLFCKILKFGDTFCKHVCVLQFHWQKWNEFDRWLVTTSSPDYVELLYLHTFSEQKAKKITHQRRQL